MIKLSAFADEAASDLNGQIATLKRNGIPYIELRCIDKKNVADFTIDEAKEYARRFEEADIAVWSIGSPLGKADITVDIDEYIKKVRHVCALANVFKTDKIRAFSFFKAYEEKEKVFDYMNRMAEVAKEYGVTLYHENEKEVYGDTLSRVQEIRENVRGWKFIYDPANFVQVGEKADDTLGALHSVTDYFHIKDVIAATDELVPAGCGDGKIDELIARITDDKVLTLEPHLAVFDAFATIDNTEMKHKFHFKDNAEAFDTAVKAVKELLATAGYKEINGGFIK